MYLYILYVCIHTWIVAPSGCVELVCRVTGGFRGCDSPPPFFSPAFAGDLFSLLARTYVTADACTTCRRRRLSCRRRRLLKSLTRLSSPRKAGMDRILKYFIFFLQFARRRRSPRKAWMNENLQTRYQHLFFWRTHAPHACVCVQTHIHTHLSAHTHTHTHSRALSLTHCLSHIYMHIYVYIHILCNIYIYILYIYIYIHTHTRVLFGDLLNDGFFFLDE